ncbi:hypothetical protein LTS06_012629, partial [Exophiala xenobiotica]
MSQGVWSSGVHREYLHGNALRPQDRYRVETLSTEESNIARQTEPDTEHGCELYRTTQPHKQFDDGIQRGP